MIESVESIILPLLHIPGEGAMFSNITSDAWKGNVMKSDLRK